MPAVRECVVAAVGAVAGLYVCGAVGGLIGAGIASFITSGGGLETLAPAVLGLFIGGTAGAIGGSWLGLRMIGADRRALTAVLLLPILIVTVLVAQAIGAGVLSVSSVSPALLTAVGAILARVIVLATTARSSL